MLSIQPVDGSTEVGNSDVGNSEVGNREVGAARVTRGGSIDQEAMDGAGPPARASVRSSRRW